MIKELIKIANTLDGRGLVKEADALDRVVRLASDSQDLVLSVGGAEVYYNAEWKEYRVIPPDSIGTDDHYHTGDKEDAIATAKIMAGTEEEPHSPDDEESITLEERKKNAVIELGAGPEASELIESLFWHARTETPWDLWDGKEEVIYLDGDRLNFVFDNGATDPQQFEEYDATSYFSDLITAALTDDVETGDKDMDIDTVVEQIMDEIS